MNNLVKKIQKKQNRTTTENGMATRYTSNSACVDLFFLGGAARTMHENDIKSLIGAAMAENQNLAIKILAYIRDPRGGNGERNFFRHALNYLSENYVPINVSQIPVIGRWDDIYSLLGNGQYEEQVYSTIMTALKNKDGLCAKWCPRKGYVANKLQVGLNLTPKEYRKLIVGLTQVVETKMCNNEWTGINYTHVPSNANMKYNKAFLRHDEERRREFLASAAKGEVKINSGVAFPSDIIKLCIGEAGSIHVKEGDTFAKQVQRNETALAMWNQLPNYMENSTYRILPMCDTSGSMRGLPILMSLGLGLYISERNKGVFKDAFITFSRTPYLQYTTGNLFDRLSQIRAFHPANTNLEAAFQLVLNTAIENKLKNSELPTHILIISDMQFDQACTRTDTALQMIKRNYKDAGYDCPNIIFWNVNSSSKQLPVKFDKDGTGLISGGSPSAIIPVLNGAVNPMDIVNKAVSLEKYEKLLM